MEQEEQALVRQAAEGQEHAFEQLVLRYQKGIYNLTLRMTGNADDAYDLAQETFLRAWIPPFPPGCTGLQPTSASIFCESKNAEK